MPDIRFPGSNSLITWIKFLGNPEALTDVAAVEIARQANSEKFWVIKYDKDRRCGDKQFLVRNRS